MKGRQDTAGHHCAMLRYAHTQTLTFPTWWRALLSPPLLSFPLFSSFLLSLPGRGGVDHSDILKRSQTGNEGRGSIGNRARNSQLDWPGHLPGANYQERFGTRPPRCPSLPWGGTALAGPLFDLPTLCVHLFACVCVSVSVCKCVQASAQARECLCVCARVCLFARVCMCL